MISLRTPLAGTSLFFLLFLAFISAFAPLSTDLYLPALPAMSEYFSASKEITNFTLSGFMLFFALSMLVWGPLSDKYGRRPILLTGSGVYVIASVICYMSTNIYVLIGGRCLQAIGSGALAAVSTALVKDRFAGKRMENVLAIVQTLTVLAPMLAPMLGGVMLLVTTWRGIFGCLIACGSLAFVGALFLKESLIEKQQGSVWHSLGRLFVVLRNDSFRRALFIFSANTMPLMAYLAVSSYTFQNLFGATPQQYSLFFAVNAACSMIGPMTYLRVLRYLPRPQYVACSFVIVGIMGVLMLLFGTKSPFVFAGLFLPITFCMSALRPCAAALMLMQHDTDTGSISALMGATALLCGVFSMLLCSLPWWLNPTQALGTITVGMGLYCFTAWLVALKRGIRLPENSRR